MSATGRPGGFGLGTDLETDEYERPQQPTPPADDPVNPSPETTAVTVAAYESSGVPPCMFGVRRDDEADLAIGEITRTCGTDDEPDEDEAEEGDAVTWDEIVGFIDAAYRDLPIAPSPITHQPEGTWALVNIDFVVYTDPAPQTFEIADLLPGLDVTFVATPVHYTWDFGDGTTLETSSPGNPYPDQDVAHVYSSATDGVVVGVTTIWQGTFQLNHTGPWLPVNTSATTTSAADPVEIVAMDVNLVPNQD